MTEDHAYFLINGNSFRDYNVLVTFVSHNCSSFYATSLSGKCLHVPVSRLLSLNEGYIPKFERCNFLYYQYINISKFKVCPSKLKNKYSERGGEI